MNVIHLVGRLGKAPEMSYSANGTAITKFSVATDDGFGEKRETTWHNVITFQKAAESCAQYLDKGSRVAITGRQTHRKYESQGGTRYWSEVVAERVDFLDARAERTGGDEQGDINPDELPF